jgi:hypothetical protein
MLASLEHVRSIAQLIHVCTYLVATLKKMYHVEYGGGFRRLMLNIESGYVG